MKHEITKWCCTFVSGEEKYGIRWIGLHCSKLDSKGHRILVRYIKGKPLALTSLEDLTMLFSMLNHLKPRTIYATANIYHELNSRSSVEDLDNIIACTPTWDIDNERSKWRATIEVCRELISFLESHGISKSIIVKWSGKAAHVHLHHEAISPELRRKYSPLDIAYAIVQYTIERLNDKIRNVRLKFSASRLRVDNEHDLQQLFTCPLSLHRDLNSVAVCINPNELDSFDIAWTDPKLFKHYTGWDKFCIGEADELAIRAIRSVGGYFISRVKRRRKHPPVDEMIMKWLKKLDSVG